MRQETREQRKARHRAAAADMVARMDRDVKRGKFKRTTPGKLMEKVHDWEMNRLKQGGPLDDVKVPTRFFTSETYLKALARPNWFAVDRRIMKFAFRMMEHYRRQNIAVWVEQARIETVPPYLDTPYSVGCGVTFGFPLHSQKLDEDIARTGYALAKKLKAPIYQDLGYEDTWALADWRETVPYFETGEVLNLTWNAMKGLCRD